MKNQALFSSTDKIKKLKCHLLQFLFGALRVKMTEYFHEKQLCHFLFCLLFSKGDNSEGKICSFKIRLTLCLALAAILFIGAKRF